MGAKLSSAFALLANGTEEKTPDGWRAVDVLYNGTISNVVKQRSDFRGPLTEGGAAQLISSLKKKIADLSGGAIS